MCKSIIKGLLDESSDHLLSDDDTEEEEDLNLRFNMDVFKVYDLDYKGVMR